MSIAALYAASLLPGKPLAAGEMKRRRGIRLKLGLNAYSFNRELMAGEMTMNDVIDFCERLRFTDDDIRCLRPLPMFSEPFLSWLRGFRFTGDVYAVPEGTSVFANEPILEIVAPLRKGSWSKHTS